jgi:hypothetical protein
MHRKRRSLLDRIAKRAGSVGFNGRAHGELSELSGVQKPRRRDVSSVPHDPARRKSRRSCSTGWRRGFHFDKHGHYSRQKNSRKGCDLTRLVAQDVVGRSPVSECAALTSSLCGGERDSDPSLRSTRDWLRPRFAIGDPVNGNFQIAAYPLTTVYEFDGASELMGY